MCVNVEEHEEYFFFQTFQFPLSIFPFLYAFRYRVSVIRKGDAFHHVTDKIIDYYKIIFCEINFRVNVEEREEIGIFFFESF